MRPSLPSVLMDFTEVLLLDQVNWASNNVLEGDKLTHTWDLGGNRLFCFISKVLLKWLSSFQCVTDLIM